MTKTRNNWLQRRTVLCSETRHIFHQRLLPLHLWVLPWWFLPSFVVLQCRLDVGHEVPNLNFLRKLWEKLRSSPPSWLCWRRLWALPSPRQNVPPLYNSVNLCYIRRKRAHPREFRFPFLLRSFSWRLTSLPLLTGVLKVRSANVLGNIWYIVSSSWTIWAQLNETNFNLNFEQDWFSAKFYLHLRLQFDSHPHPWVYTFLKLEFCTAQPTLACSWIVSPTSPPFHVTNRAPSPYLPWGSARRETVRLYELSCWHPDRNSRHDRSRGAS